jgi:hypothetical protein
MKMIKKKMTGSFIRGALLCLAIIITVQDYMGLEKYIESLRKHWGLMPWWVGFSVVVLVILVESYAQKNSENPNSMY